MSNEAVAAEPDDGPPVKPVVNEPQVHPSSADRTKPMFRIYDLRSSTEEGHAIVTLVHLLAASVYDARHATRYAAHEAQALERGVLLAVIAPSGRTVTVLLGGSGRRAGAPLARRAIREVRRSLPGATNGARKARTSRPRTAIRRHRR
jgi:hypothetical protein